MEDECRRDKENEVKAENGKIENRSATSSDAWYKDGINEEVENFDKAVEFNELFSL